MSNDRIRGLSKCGPDGRPLPPVSIFSVMDLSDAPRDPVTGEIIITMSVRPATDNSFSVDDLIGPDES